MRNIKSLRQVDRDWQDFPDGHYQRKNVGHNWIVELIYGTERGGIILLWERTEMGKEDEIGSLAWEISNQDALGYFSEEYKVVKLDDGQLLRLFTQVNFMDYRNAQDEYRHLTSEKAIITLAVRGN